MPIGVNSRLNGWHWAPMKKFFFFSRTGDGALSSDAAELDAHGRAGSLGGHGRSQAGSSNAGGGHCDGLVVRGEDSWKALMR
jgi:hypothetical protein